MKIYTKKGDQGKTSLIGGVRVSKHHLRIECYGTVDELNSWLGVLRDHEQGEEMRELLKKIQDLLFTIGSLLASHPEKSRMKLPELTEKDIVLMEQSIDEITSRVSPLTSFILPGGEISNSFSHVARCVCRRAERLIVALTESENVPPLILQFMNRLSDWLFAYARHRSHINGAEEIPWTPSSSSSK